MDGQRDELKKATQFRQLGEDTDLGLLFPDPLAATSQLCVLTYGRKMAKPPSQNSEQNGKTLFPLIVCISALFACVGTMCVLSDCGGQKRASDPLELKLGMAVSHSVGPGSWKNNNCSSQALSHSSGLKVTVSKY